MRWWALAWNQVNRCCPVSDCGYAGLPAPSINTGNSGGGFKGDELGHRHGDAMASRFQTVWEFGARLRIASNSGDPRQSCSGARNLTEALTG